MQATKYILLTVALFYCMSFQLPGAWAVTCEEDSTAADCINCTDDPDNEECTTTTTTTTSETTTTTTTTTTAPGTSVSAPASTGGNKKKVVIKNLKFKVVRRIKRKSG